ncbi:unnamed protein product [Blepharisma stoltei]|uniref:Ornithine aminotransferase n=1 Tax=Blepharisma stoltei TaxID=1481888 RepID=A0AAU9JK69_9CILI|nr:unnamed protein product [Blepharisma stoltei]
MISKMLLRNSGSLKSLTRGGEPFIQKELDYGAHNYHPLPVVLQRGQGIYVWDIAGKRYMDFLSAYSAVNQGHCHPKIVQTMIDQAQVLTITSRAFYNNLLGDTEELLCKTFGYQKVLMMNSGAEAGESAVKIARRWGYQVKGIPDNQAKVIFCTGNFWGRTLAACGSSDDPDRYRNFGPFGGLNFHLVPYDNIESLEEELKNPNTAAFMMEPIQGEAGVVVPSKGYLTKVRELCTKYNVLMIADEIQTGIGRAGKLLAVEWEGIKPDIVTLGKSLSGGLMPISAVLADESVLQVLDPNSHGSTFGGNPLACKIAKTALEVVFEENLINNSRELGEVFRAEFKKLEGGFVKEVRGKGLMNALEISTPSGAWELCEKMAEKGLLAKPTHGNIIRFAPPLVINREQLYEGISIIYDSIKESQ